MIVIPVLIQQQEKEQTQNLSLSLSLSHTHTHTHTHTQTQSLFGNCLSPPPPLSLSNSPLSLPTPTPSLAFSPPPPLSLSFSSELLCTKPVGHNQRDRDNNRFVSRLPRVSADCRVYFKDGSTWLVLRAAKPRQKSHIKLVIAPCYRRSILVLGQLDVTLTLWCQMPGK